MLRATMRRSSSRLSGWFTDRALRRVPIEKGRQQGVSDANRSAVPTVTIFENVSDTA